MGIKTFKNIFRHTGNRKLAVIYLSIPLLYAAVKMLPIVGYTSVKLEKKMLPSSLSCWAFEWFSDGFRRGGLSRSIRNSSLSEKKLLLERVFSPGRKKNDTFTKFQEYVFCF